MKILSFIQFIKNSNYLSHMQRIKLSCGNHSLMRGFEKYITSCDKVDRGRRLHQWRSVAVPDRETTSDHKWMRLLLAVY